MNRLLKTFCVLFFFLTGAANVLKASPPDSLRTKWINGQKYILHKVAPKETFSAVSRRYHVDLSDLQKANPGVSVLKIGQIIQVPLSGKPADAIVEKIDDAPAAAPKPKQKPATATHYHTVQKGETLYRISKENGITVDELKKLNNLNSNNVAIGAKLIVGKGPAAANQEAPPMPTVKAPVEQHGETPKQEVTTKEEVKPAKVAEEKPAASEVPAKTETPAKTEAAPKSETPAKADQAPKADSASVFNTPGNSRSSVTEKDPKSGNTVERVTETGIAAWITNGELNQNKFYALHRSAPVGTIIKVTNRMNNNSVFVKVVGLLPDTGDNAGILIKITQASAQRIGALDQRFQAELTYGITK